MLLDRASVVWPTVSRVRHSCGEVAVLAFRPVAPSLSASLPAVTDVSSGWFALGGTLVGVVGSQVAAVISATGKARARKLKNQRQDQATKADKRRVLYELLILQIDKAELLTAKVLASMDREPGGIHYASSVREVIEPVRSTCISVQIDGSDVAREIASELLDATHELWFQVTLDEENDAQRDAVEASHDALKLSHTSMVGAARADFGG